MKILENKKKLDNLLEKIRVQDLKIGLIPTMGSIHEGHISLIEQSKHSNCFSIVTIFVNPTQFNNLEDFNNYPKNKEEDINRLKQAECDALYFPQTQELYPSEVKSKKTIFDYREVLCDRFRPGHFDGVTTVVKSLFNLVKPHKVFFGEKDFQQLKLINKVIEKNILPIRLISCPSIRLNNGMSISSRYNNFSSKEKKILDKIAIKINSCVKELRKNINLSFLEKLNQELRNYDVNKIDYLEIREEENLQLTEKKTKARLFVAFYLGKIRIIDNFILY
tara:strand:+ start:1005 stop:1838 length:834 start_codon:yes stop_codon:yes gene_type:complete